MSKTVAGLVTFGNLNFTKLAVQSVLETSTYDVDIFIVIGKPGDTETLEWVEEMGYRYVMHEENYGFPYSINDIYDFAWVENDYDNLILLGNDIVAYEGAIDQMIELADEGEYLVISALQYDVKSLVKEYPEVAGYFESSRFIFSDFEATPWDVFENPLAEQEIADMQLYDIQNLCLYTRKCFEEIGYVDVNFYPAYYVDNDYARRIVESGIKCCSLASARFFHFWSRTIHQGEGGSNAGYFKNNLRYFHLRLGEGGSNAGYFKNNRSYYILKWGGDFGRETRTPDLKIDSRENEIVKIKRWMQK